MKKLILSVFTILLSLNITGNALAIESSGSEIYIATENCEYINPNYCGNNSLTNGLQSNQTTLFYMYSNRHGHFFIDPLADVENVIYVGRNDYNSLPELKIDVKTLYHGKRFIGTFVNNDLWELEGLQAVEIE